MILSGWARVDEILPCPTIQPGRGRVVLSTVTHLNGYVLRVWLDSQSEPLEPTDTHRLFSEDRGDWTPAGELEVGERLRTAHGSATITQIELKPGIHQVYNLEVETEHSYFVGFSSVLSHNINPCGESGGGGGGRVTGEQLSKARGEFEKMKPDIWKEEAARNPQKYSQEQLARARQGQAPIGDDGYPMEIHHKQLLSEGGSNITDNFDFLTRSGHRLGENFSKNHPR